MSPELAQRSPDDPLTIILCGGRRTGTTLLAAVLSSDPRTNPLGQEAQILTRLVEAYRWGRENFRDFGRSFFDDSESYRAFFEKTATRFCTEVAARVSPGGVLVLKNPELSRVLLDVAELLPAALVIASVRDPRDQVASELKVGLRQLAAGEHAPHIQRRDVALLAHLYADYCREVLALRDSHPERIHIVRYEDLAFFSDDVLARLRVATGLDLPFDATEPWPRVSPLANLQSGPSRSDLYGGPVKTSSVGRFDRDLTVVEVAEVEKAVPELMDALGYPLPARRLVPTRA